VEVLAAIDLHAAEDGAALLLLLLLLQVLGALEHLRMACTKKERSQMLTIRHQIIPPLLVEVETVASAALLVTVVALPGYSSSQMNQP
jgi:hypothetical protein